MADASGTAAGGPTVDATIQRVGGPQARGGPADRTAILLRWPRSAMGTP